MHVMASNKSTRPNSRRQLSAANDARPYAQDGGLRQPSLGVPRRKRQRLRQIPQRIVEAVTALQDCRAQHQDGNRRLRNPTTASGPPPRSRCNAVVFGSAHLDIALGKASRETDIVRVLVEFGAQRRNSARSLPEVTGTRSRTIASSAGTYGCAATRPESRQIQAERTPPTR